MAISAVAWDLQKRLRSLEQSHLLVRHSFSHPKSHPEGGLKHQKEKRSMDYFAGLDVSVKETSICIVDDAGKIVREVRVASEPEALLQVLTNNNYRFKRIGLEAGPLSQWLFSALAEAGLPVICVETRHMRAVLKAQINKTDRNDARGIAQMMRV